MAADPPEWDEFEAPDWKEEQARKREESLDAMLRRFEREQWEKFHPKDSKKPNGDGGAGFSSSISPLPFIRASEWYGQPRPELEFLDQRKWLPMQASTILSGAGATGKTLLMLQLGVACVTGSRWLGGYVRKGPVVFYSAEEPL